MIDKLIAAQNASPKNIVVIGDCMRDVYIHGTVSECQDGCPKFVETSRVVCPGGAWNAGNTLRHWYPVDTAYRWPDMAVKTRWMVDGKCVFRSDDDQTLATEKELQEARKLALKAVENADAVLLSDYDKGFLTREFVSDISDACKKRDIRLVIDPKRPPAFYPERSPAIAKCNMAYFKKWPNIRRTVVTDGERLPLIVDGVVGQSQSRVTIASHDNPPLRHVPCVSHIGGGDCFAAHLALGMAHESLFRTFKDIVLMAHSAARCYVQFEHNRPPWPHEIKKDINPVHGKLFTGNPADLRESLADVPVFTNGIFRIPHAGHAWLLRYAKECSGSRVLVVGINTDESAAQLKRGKYVMPLAERIEMLASMECADWIIPFNEPTPSGIVEKLRPACIVKGSEYNGLYVPGQEFAPVTIAPPSPFREHATDIEPLL